MPHQTKNCESVCKPDSVFVWRFIYAANPDGPRATSTRPYLALLPVGFARWPVTRTTSELLPHYFTLTRVGRRDAEVGTSVPASQLRRFVSVALSVGLPRPGLRRAPCPMKSGLSSPRSKPRSRHPSDSQ